LAEARVFPSGLKASEFTEARCPNNRLVAFVCSPLIALATSQSWIAESQPLDASVLPSGLKATDSTRSQCASRGATVLPRARSHIVTVPSALPEASILPSGAKAMRQTASGRVALSLPDAVSQSLITSSRPEHEANVLPSGLNAKCRTRPAFSSTAQRSRGGP